MSTQFNLKDAATVDLARSLAKRSGRTITRTIRDALERERREEEAEVAERLRRMEAFLSEVDLVLNPEWKGKTAEQLTDGMYDAGGAPAW